MGSPPSREPKARPPFSGLFFSQPHSLAGSLAGSHKAESGERLPSLRSQISDLARRPSRSRIPALQSPIWGILLPVSSTPYSRSSIFAVKTQHLSLKSSIFCFAYLFGQVVRRAYWIGHSVNLIGSKFDLLVLFVVWLSNYTVDLLVESGGAFRWIPWNFFFFFLSSSLSPSLCAKFNLLHVFLWIYGS